MLLSGSFHGQSSVPPRPAVCPERAAAMGPGPADSRTSVTAVVSKVPQVVERPRRFPAAVEIELERRRRLLLGQVAGRVLDLDLAEHRAEVARASVERHVVPAYDTALETLAGLQQDGKLIGVISHVPALKERISTQIQVSPQTGGRSQISGPGCGSVVPV